ncbi:MAG: hypothetical protein II644_06520 [Paludibacteraceae bacterium]|nr:hypothetical protein [Paludibacteraceae bacterium]
MRKYLFFAIALVAGTLAFTSCEPNNPNKPESQEIDPKEVTAKDIVGEWLLDSVIFNNEYGYYQMDRQLITVRTNDLDVRDRKKNAYTVKDGIITVNYSKNEWNDVDDSYTATYEIVSFDKGLKRAELKEHVEYIDGDQPVEGYMHYYLSVLPEPTGKDLDINEANIKGAWLCAYYEHYAEGETAIKEVSPHFEFEFFGDNHKFAWLMGVSAVDGYFDTGFWWFKPGYMYMTVAYNKTLSDYNEDDLYWWKIEKLTEDYMILSHRDDGYAEVCHFVRRDMSFPSEK